MSHQELNHEFDFEKICRFCTKQARKLRYIYATDGRGGPSLPSKVLECQIVNIMEGDGLPSKVCSSCAEKITLIYDFKALCRESDHRLRWQQRQMAGNNLNLVTEIKDELKAEDVDPLAEMMIVKNEHVTIIRKVSSADEREKSPEDVPLEIDLAEMVEVTYGKSESGENSKFRTRSKTKRKLNKKRCKRKEVNENVKTDIMKNETTEPKSEDDDVWLDDDKPLCKGKAVDSRKNRRRKIDQCQVCGKLTTGLKQHLLVHNGLKPYKCNYCGKSFSQQGNFKYHLNIHTGNRPFVCSVCGKACADPNSLKHHMVTHTKERNFQCNTCGKTFGYAHTLSTHKRSHTQDRTHVCSVCGKAFLFNQGLVKHMRIHTGERPYKCEYCGKGCTSSGNLKTHKRVHTREKPYHCNECDRNFSHRSALNLHCKMHEKQSDVSLVC